MDLKVNNIQFCGGKLPNFERTQRQLYHNRRYNGVPNFENPRTINTKKSFLKTITNIFKAFYYANFK